MLTVDLHAAQIQGFFNIPVDELTALNLLGDYFKKRALPNLVVVAADINATKRTRNLGSRLGAPLAIMEKRRIGNIDKTEMLNVIGEVEGKTALIVDDEIDTAGSLTGVVATLIERGAREVYACCTHALFSGSAIQRIMKSPVKEVVVTDTYPVSPQKRIDKITVLPIAPLLGEAIRRIHTGQSIGAMFE
jgi:ribose-phosphate pyrophosphokinase